MWVPKTSRSTGKTYYYNTETKKTTWIKPEELSSPTTNNDRKEAVKNEKRVASAYSKVAEGAGKEARANTKKIRKWNNLIKRHMINNNIPPMQDIKVLDLCCGRGGDMGKLLQHSNVKKYRGIDISDGAIKEAIKRSEVHNKHGTWMDFLVLDVANSTAESWTGYNAHEAQSWVEDPVYSITLLNEQYDATAHHFSLINMQYALHYMCKTKKSARDFLKRVCFSLDHGPFGAFIGTVPSSERIRQAVRGDYKLPEYCKVTPGKRWKGNNRFGDPYNFYLEGGVLDLEEYLVPKEQFIALAKECGLKIRLYMNAGAYLELETSRRIDGYYSANTTGSTKQDCLRKNEQEELDWNVTSLYDVFMFTKS